MRTSFVKGRLRNAVLGGLYKRRRRGSNRTGPTPAVRAYLSANAKTVRKPCWLILAMSSPLTFSTLSLG